MIASPQAAYLRSSRDASSNATGRLGNLAAFAVPLTLPVESRSGGQLFLPEILLLLALPFLLDEARRSGVRRVSTRVVTLGVLWFGSLVFTDIYRGSTFRNYSRGWANIVFILVDFAGIALLVDGRWRRVTLFAAGLAVGQVLEYIFNPGTFAAGDPWKFGYGTAITLGGILFAAGARVYRRPTIAAAIAVAFGVINLDLGFRSLAGVCFMAALFVLLAVRSTYLTRSNRKALRILTVLAASAIAGIVVVSAYGFVASHGVLGARAQQKYEQQQGGLGVVVGGRGEVIPALMAIRDSPLIGHGSWAQGPKYVEAFQAELRSEGYHAHVNTSSGLIPSHSYLLGAWVDGGILGGLFWAVALALAVSILPFLHRLGDGRIVLVAFIDILFIWAVLFSPLGAQARLTAAFSLVVVLMTREATASIGACHLPDTTSTIGR